MTAFTTEIWSKTLLANLKDASGGFSGRIVNHNFHNAGGTKADAVKVIVPTLSVIGTSAETGLAMPTGYGDAASSTITINLDTPIKYALGIPWDLQLKTEHDVIQGYRMAAEDICVRIRNNQVFAALQASASIPVITGTAAAPTYVNKDNILDQLDAFRVQLMKTGAIMEFGTYRFVDTESHGESVSELAGEQTPFEMDGQEVPGVLAGQVKTALPALGVPAALYQLIISAATKAGELTQNKEFYGHVPVIRGFEICLDENLNQMGATSNKHLLMYAGTRNLVTEAMTDSRSEVIPDQNNYKDILRGLIVYGCAVTNPNCGAKGFFTLTAPSGG